MIDVGVNGSTLDNEARAGDEAPASDPAGMESRDPLTILAQLAREFEAAHRNREQAMARFPFFPGPGGHSAFSTAPAGS